jgi:hypothetical protein
MPADILVHQCGLDGGHASGLEVERVYQAIKAI